MRSTKARRRNDVTNAPSLWRIWRDERGVWLEVDGEIFGPYKEEE